MQAASGERRAGFKRLSLPLMSLGNFAQLPFDRAGTGEQAAVDFVETVVGCIEHEAAGDPNGDADRSAIELDCKSLRNHEDFTPGAQQRPGHVDASRLRLPA